MNGPERQPWWLITPRGLLTKMALIAAGVALLTILATEWLRHEIRCAPTRHADGRVTVPDC